MTARILERPDRDLIRKLYDPAQLGVLRMSDALSQDTVKNLRREILAIRDREAFAHRLSAGKVKENSYTFYFGSADQNNSVTEAVLKANPTLSNVVRGYTQSVYNVSAAEVGFAQVELVNSIGIHFYPRAGGGISYHQDFKADVNLIGIVTVDGVAVFYSALDREGRGESGYSVAPGDIILMRANLEAPLRHENDLRPFHRVNPVAGDRISIVLRNKSPQP